MSTIFTKPFRPLDWAATPHDFTGDNQLGPYTVDSTQRFIYGTRYLTWDGRVFKYSKSNAVCYTGRGSQFGGGITADGIAFTILPTASTPAGSREISMTNGAILAQVEDGLAGGYAIMGEKSTGDWMKSTSAYLQERGIVGNTAAETNAVTILTLDSPLNTTLTDSHYGYCRPSPYDRVGLAGSDSKSCAGVAAVYVSGTGYYFWVQTWGPCFIAPQLVCGNTANGRQLVFRHDGTFDTHRTIGVALQQHAGFIIDDSEVVQVTGNGAWLMMLQVSI